MTVQDRGPHALGRIADVSPGTAEKLGMQKDSVTPVAITPIAVRGSCGSMKGSNDAGRAGETRCELRSGNARTAPDRGTKWAGTPD